MGTTYGIPCGNTVAVVGDPGTGKTTLLLSYLTYASIKGEGQGGVLTLCTPQDNKSDAFTTLNNRQNFLTGENNRIKCLHKILLL